MRFTILSLLPLFLFFLPVTHYMIGEIYNAFYGIQEIHDIGKINHRLLVTFVFVNIPNVQTL